MINLQTKINEPRRLVIELIKTITNLAKHSCIFKIAEAQLIVRGAEMNCISI